MDKENIKCKAHDLNTFYKPPILIINFVNFCSHGSQSEQLSPDREYIYDSPDETHILQIPLNV